MIPDADIVDRLWAVPAAAARLIEQSPTPVRLFTPDVHTGVLDVLLRCAPQRGEAFVMFQLVSPLLPGSYDADADTVDHVLTVLNRFEVSDVACHQTFGPNWREVISHAFGVADLVDDNGVALTPVATDSHRRLGAWVRAREVADDAGRLDHWYRAQAAAWEPRFGNLTLEVVVAMRDVAAALAIADLVGHGSFTRDHLDTLTTPWRPVARA